jgi:polyisoprenoid-binding protein YceI
MVTLTLHGATRTLEVPIRLEQRPREVAVSGRLALNQTDFGIVPFSILGGAITVQDRVDVRFAITAREVAP